jgi:hypothetical protein
VATLKSMSLTKQIFSGHTDDARTTPRQAGVVRPAGGAGLKSSLEERDHERDDTE